MQTKSTKETDKKLSKKERRKNIEMKVEAALSFLHTSDVDQKKLKHLLKDAGKLFSTVDLQQSVTKTKQKTMASKKTAVKKQLTAKEAEIKKS